MSDSNDTILRRHWLYAGVLACSLMASSAALGAVGSCEIRAARAQESIPAASLESWEPIDDHTLLIWAFHETRAHLVRLDRPIPGLASAAIIYLVAGDHDRAISACGHDGVMVGRGGRARIVAIRYLSERRTAELDRGAALSKPETITA